MKKFSALEILKENKGFLVFITLMLVFRSAVADWNDVPSGSMKPTLVEGDRILIDKLAYDINLPFIQYSVKKLADPQVNDIIIFESKKANKRLVKRVVAVPGDTISMTDSQLTINGKTLTYQATKLSNHLVEQLGSYSHTIQVPSVSRRYDNFNEITVPAGHYLVLGDNRGNSADSRAIGFVPRDEIIGKSSKVIFSLDYENYFLMRKNRFLLDI